jgi:hypothetical protein
MSAAEPSSPPVEDRSSFWTGAPRILTGLATVVGSFVGLATVLVQAGMIGSSSPTPAQPAPARTVAAVTVKADAPAARETRERQHAAPETRETPPETASLDQALARLNELLAESARTKGDLGSLIGRVSSSPPTIDSATAIGEIDAIVRQREGLHATLAAFPAPDALSQALALLRDSITASLAYDRLVRQWIVARYDGDPAAGRLWEAQLEASREASRAKSAFRAEYAGRLASRGLSSIIPDY